MSGLELRILDIAFYVASAIAIIAIPFLVFNWFKYMKMVRSLTGPAFLHWAYFPNKSVLFFVIPLILTFAIASAMTSEVRSQVLSEIAAMPSESEVFINGSATRDPDKVLAALRTIAPMAAHHTHPTKTITVLLQKPNGGNLVLLLRRDSGLPQEYWVFYPRYRVTKRNEIGRIKTQVFNAY